MKKDFVYEDRGQFKLLQNAERLGGFVMGDQGVVPSERVIPEQRFAHQPIFRKQDEEVIIRANYLLWKKFLIYTVEKRRETANWFTSPTLDVMGLVSKKNPTTQAKEIAEKFLTNEVLTAEEEDVLAEHYLNDGAGSVDTLGYQERYPRIFTRRHGFYKRYDPGPPHNDYLKRGTVGKTSLRNIVDITEVPSFSRNDAQEILCLFKDKDLNGNIFYGLIIEEAFNCIYEHYSGIVWDVYTATSLSGPWTRQDDQIWLKVDARHGDPLVEEWLPGAWNTDLSGLIDLMQKDECWRLFRRIGYSSNTPISTSPVFLSGLDLGKKDELVGVTRFDSPPTVVAQNRLCRRKKVEGGIELHPVGITLRLKNGNYVGYSGSPGDAYGGA